MVSTRKPCTRKTGGRSGFFFCGGGPPGALLSARAPSHLGGMRDLSGRAAARRVHAGRSTSGRILHTGSDTRAPNSSQQRTSFPQFSHAPPPDLLRPKRYQAVKMFYSWATTIRGGKTAGAGPAPSQCRGRIWQPDLSCPLTARVSLCCGRRQDGARPRQRDTLRDLRPRLGAAPQREPMHAHQPGKWAMDRANGRWEPNANLPQAKQPFSTFFASQLLRPMWQGGCLSQMRALQGGLLLRS